MNLYLMGLRRQRLVVQGLIGNGKDSSLFGSGFFTLWIRILFTGRENPNRVVVAWVDLCHPVTLHCHCHCDCGASVTKWKSKSFGGCVRCDCPCDCHCVVYPNECIVYPSLNLNLCRIPAVVKEKSSWPPQWEHTSGVADGGRVIG